MIYMTRIDATVLFVFALFSRKTAGLGLQNGVALTPPMGWNPFNVFGCDTTEDDYHRNGIALSLLGLKDLGYKYLSMDCGWTSNERNSSGQIMWNATRLPSGMAPLGSFVHALGLLFGIQSDVGYYSCDLSGGSQHWIGSKGYEEADAKTFVSWGMDYLKYDNCFVVNDTDFVDWDPPITERLAFQPMRAALNNTDRPVVYAINDWGIQDVARWPGFANTWRISNNIGPSFSDLQRIINEVVPIASYAAPGGWNDLDLLEVGNEAMTEAEWKTNFAFWAAAKSPLLISAELTTVSEEALNILMNKRLIAVNQDSLGQSIAFKRRYTDEYDVWAGPLADGSTAVLLLNWKDTNQTIQFDMYDVGFSSAELTDLWSGTSFGTQKRFYTSTVDAHGVLAYQLSNGIPTGSYSFKHYYANASSNILVGGASLRQLSPGESVAGNIGMGGEITIVGIDGGANGGTALTSISYINADYTFQNTDCSNCRRVLVSVNGGNPVVAEMPISGMSWNLLFEGYLLGLDGFLPGAQNNITLKNPAAWAPDIYSIGVQI